MSRLALYFLGPFQALLHGRAATGFRSDKARALLTYLAIEADRPHAREALAEMLWPDYPGPAGLTYLRAALLNLRTLLGDHAADHVAVHAAADLSASAAAGPAAGAPPFLLSTRETIQLNPAAAVWVDAKALGRLMTGRPALDELVQGVALCRGPFLEGFSTDAGSVFDEWLLLTREQVNRQALTAMQRLAQIYLEQGEFARAEDTAFRQLTLDMWDETATRQLMAALALQGKRNAALAQFEQCRTLLAQAMRVEPSSDTVMLRAAIHAGTFQETWARTHADRHSAPADPAPAPHTPYAAPPVVARARELELLQQHLDHCLHGAGSVVFVVGGAGSGKTTLLHEFAQRTLAQHVEIGVVAGRCSDYTGSGDPYLPFRTMLEMLTGDVQSCRVGAIVSEAHTERLWKQAPLAAQLLAETAPNLVGSLVPAEMLLLRVEAMTIRGDGTGAAWRARLAQRAGTVGKDAALVTNNLFEQVTEYLFALARRVPLLLLVDDLQWADTGSISLLFHLGRQLAGSRILIVGAYRPEEVALGLEGGRSPLMTAVGELQRTFGDLGIDLDRADGRRFIDELLDSEPNRLEAAFRETLCAHTEGHPLFTTELLHRLLEQGVLAQGHDGACEQVLPAVWESLPPRVVAVIAERIGRLPNEWSQLLRAASVEGDVFSAEVLVQAGAPDAARVFWALSEPLRRQYRLVQPDAQLRVGPQAKRLSRYRFVHSLFRQYLYNSLDAVELSHLHERVACALELMYGPAAHEVAVQLAWHYEQAGVAEKSIHFHSLAGDQAMHLSACEQAIAHYQKALELLGTLPASPARTDKELALHVALATPLNFMRGWGSPAAAGAAARALELGRSTGGRAQLVHTLLLQATEQVGRGNPAQALALGRELLRLAQETGDPLSMVAAHFAQGDAHFFGAEPALALPHLQEALALLDGDMPASQILATDLKVTCLSLLAWVLWCLGFPDQSNQSSEAALARARALDDPVSIGFALSVAGVMLDGARGDMRAAQAHTEALGDLAAVNGLNLYRTIAAIYQGVGRVSQGENEAGIAQIRQGLDTWDATGTAAGRAVFTLVLVRALRMSGHVEQALHVVESALTAVAAGGLRLVEAELWRSKGELLLAQATDSTAAEACFQRALTLARGQRARIWELHAAVSLGRLWQAQGKEEAAYDLLAPLCSWFTEGFDTPDLQEARLLLQNLTKDGARAFAPQL